MGQYWFCIWNSSLENLLLATNYELRTPNYELQTIQRTQTNRMFAVQSADKQLGDNLSELRRYKKIKKIWNSRRYFLYFMDTATYYYAHNEKLLAVRAFVLPSR